ncbi:hypothetical protein AB0D14_29015 [Streptomyces sp. NPDC048484]|uniref:hypothetical protein n=1 Tax=Streptomyces sp. NPDC048484 TaxID=3155146 RepID=UPI00344457AE
MSGSDERARHDEHGRHGDDEYEQRAGNGTVKHGPSENPGSEESGQSDTQADTQQADAQADTGADVEGRLSDSASATDGPSADSPATARDAETPTRSKDDTPTESMGDTPPLASGNTSDHASGSTPGDSDTKSADQKPEGNGEPGTGGPGADMFGSDELALRRLLHQAVEEIEPTDGTLDHLRRAVPARRARKRQAVVGVAAAALFIGTAVPALVHVSNSAGSDADPSMVGDTSATQGGANEGKEASAGGGSGGSSGSSKGSGKDGKKDEAGKGKGGTGGTAGVEPSVSAAGAPTCGPAQLVAASGGAGAPDAVGAVYGTFTITNVSAASCTVVGGGSVSPAALGAADPAKLTAALHMAGDAATGLPDPSTYASSLVLRPGGTYEVKFAWVPSATCPTDGGNGGGPGGGEPSPDPSPTENPSGDNEGTSSEGSSGMGSQLMKADGTVDGSVSVSYAAEGGAPTASTTVSNACSGTVYRTGALAGP